MKQKDIKKCVLCGEGVMHGGQVTFYRLQVERLIINVGAVKRQHGLEIMLGSPQLAAVMGTDEDIARPVDGEPIVAIVCEECSMKDCLAAIYERAGRDEEGEGMSE